MKRGFLLLVACVLTLVCSASVAGCAAKRMAAIERGDADSESQVLVACKMTRFKELVAMGLLEDLATSGHHVKVIGLREVEEEALGQYQAIVLLNAFKMMSLDANVRGLLDNLDEDVGARVILVTTTPHVHWKYFHREAEALGVDAITAASRKTDPDSLVEDLVAKVEHLSAQ